ncbi:hypothetical protein M3Y99_01040600 [Aphelenchoides fujianensis]|nr:hypothetical protein M3Y99_01040600 [Aphelenchoides fujianensis]
MTLERAEPKTRTPTRRPLAAECPPAPRKRPSGSPPPTPQRKLRRKALFPSARPSARQPPLEDFDFAARFRAPRPEAPPKTAEDARPLRPLNS